MGYEVAHVRDVYDRIAPEFDHTRSKAGAVWNGVGRFLDSIPSNATVLDCGCGNGKYAARRSIGATYVGLDVCMPLINIAAAKFPTHEFLLASASHPRLPFNDHSFDHTICIAVLHHMDTYSRRLELLKELFRVTRASILITVWAAEQHVKPKWQCLTSANHQNDYLVPWHSNRMNLTLYRYYHLFSRDELCALLTEAATAGNMRRPFRYELAYECDNWNVLIRFDETA